MRHNSKSVLEISEGNTLDKVLGGRLMIQDLSVTREEIDKVDKEIVELIEVVHIAEFISIYLRN